MTIDRLDADKRFFKRIGCSDDEAYELAISIKHYIYGHIAYSELEPIAQTRFDVKEYDYYI